MRWPLVRRWNPRAPSLVTGHGGEAVAKAAHAIDPEIEIVEQTEQLGTGHAVLQARDPLDGFTGRCGRAVTATPRSSARKRWHAMAEARAAHDVVALGFEAADRGRYGRLVMDEMTRLTDRRIQGCHA